MSMIIDSLKTNEHHEYFSKYLDLIPRGTDLYDGLVDDEERVIEFYSSIPFDKQNHRYEEGKWSIKEVLQHLIDTERIFSNRCFRIARRDLTALPGFDQDIYVEPSNSDNKSMDDLISEFMAQRTATLSLVQSLSDEDLTFIGQANGANTSPRAVSFMNIGHSLWHERIIKERYLGV